MAAIIETRERTTRFASLTTVGRLNLRVEEGEIFGLVGPDGAGQPRMLCGLMDDVKSNMPATNYEIVLEP